MKNPDPLFGIDNDQATPVQRYRMTGFGVQFYDWRREMDSYWRNTMWNHRKWNHPVFGLELTNEPV